MDSPLEDMSYIKDSFIVDESEESSNTETSSDEAVTSDDESIDGNQMQVKRATKILADESIIRPVIARKKTFFNSDSEEEEYQEEGLGAAKELDKNNRSTNESMQELSTVLDNTHLEDEVVNSSTDKSLHSIKDLAQAPLRRSDSSTSTEDLAQAPLNKSELDKSNRSTNESMQELSTELDDTHLEDEVVNTSSDLSLHSIESSPKKGLYNQGKSDRLSNNIFDALSSTKVYKEPVQTVRAFDGSLIKSELLTPRNVKRIESRSPSPSKSDIESVHSSSSNVIEIISDSDDGNEVIKQSVIETKLKQPTLQQILNKTNSAAPDNLVSREELQFQKELVAKLRVDLQKTKNTLNTVNLSALPDKGNLLKQRYQTVVDKLNGEEAKLNSMLLTVKDAPVEVPTLPKPVSWMDIEAGSSAVQPKTFGKQAMATHNLQKALTMERLESLHGSLKSCPAEDTIAEDPRGLKIELMPHQRHALAWLMWREKQKPKGGILADDMGLGKTLTMISLMMKTNEEQENEERENSDEDEDNEEDEKRYKYTGGTLIVCPASLISQWDGEVRNRTKRGLISVELYHGPNRETKSKRLCKFDMVITTYSIVMNELDKGTPINKIKWKRIILDEAHQIRNYKSRTAIAIFKLSAHTRWVLTGTPIHNKEADLYSLLKFLRCSPFDDLNVFKRWATEKNAGGSERLNTVMSSLMLRRTKAQLQMKGSLQCLPERNWEIVEIHLDKPEMDVYQKVLIFSHTLFSQYLHQRAEKNQDRLGFDNRPIYETKFDPNSEYAKMHKKLVGLNKMKEVKQHQILVLLLRLRQICCHPSLITAMLEDGDIGADEEMYDQEGELNILDQLNKLQLDDSDAQIQSRGAHGLPNEAVDLSEATKGILNASQPIFNRERVSSKMSVAIKLLTEKILPNGDKCIIVSQWANFLRLFAIQLKNKGFEYLQLDGTIPVNKRAPIIDALNDPNNKVKILLLSLTAGGVGLNLVGANHLVLLDLHWNPQLEMQAQDRIYRVGQKKPVNVYKLMVTDTIEERIKFLQDRKMEIADSLLTGAKIRQNKLTLDDLKMLFQL